MPPADLDELRLRLVRHSSSPDSTAALASSTTASISASGTSAGATTASTAPIGSRPRPPATIRRIGPATGDSRVPAILSVSMSTMSSPLAIVSPSAT